MYVQLYVSLLPKAVYFVILKVRHIFQGLFGFEDNMIVMKEAGWKG